MGPARRMQETIADRERSGRGEEEERKTPKSREVAATSVEAKTVVPTGSNRIKCFILSPHYLLYSTPDINRERKRLHHVSLGLMAC
jgi:hypothetical protein